MPNRLNTAATAPSTNRTTARVRFISTAARERLAPHHEVRLDSSGHSEAEPLVKIDRRVDLQDPEVNRQANRVRTPGTAW